ncbi:MAG: hypothetical protein ABW154_07740 [Dyella sp.]
MSTALIEAMVRASLRGRREGHPNCYYWEAVWWRLHARASKNPAEALRFSRNQLRLFWDIKHRPDHFQRKPDGMTDWQWSGLA